MTEHFPSLSARQIVHVLEQLGFLFVRQHGSHAFYRHPETRRTTSVPMHSGDIKRGVVMGIVKQTGVSREEFFALV